MIDLMEDILPYITGLYTLPWILVGLVVTYLLSGKYGEERVTVAMKKIGMVLLFVFIPLLLFRIFLNINFGREELIFSGITFSVLAFSYLLSYVWGTYEADRHGLTGVERRNFTKTVLTNQGRSSAFVGGALLAIEEWQVPAGIYISLVGIGLFAVMPYILARLHRKEHHGGTGDTGEVKTLPWFLNIYPWYLLSFVLAAVAIHHVTDVTVSDLEDGGVVLRFVTALTIPAGLYYVGASIHPRDLKIEERKKMFAFRSKGPADLHWIAARNAFVATMFLTPLAIGLIFGTALALGRISPEWFSVLFINSVLPITSTNMFLVPYGIDRKGTALAVTWTTVVSVPLFMLLIVVLSGL